MLTADTITADTITIRVHNVDVRFDDTRQGPHLQAVGYLPGGQVLINGRIFAGHSPSVQGEAVKEVADWLRKHRPNWNIATLPGEGVIGFCSFCRVQFSMPLGLVPGAGHCDADMSARAKEQR